MEQPVADCLRLGLFELAVEAGHLNPGDERPGDKAGGNPGEVLGEARERQVLKPAVFPAPDPVLDAGMAALAKCLLATVGLNDGSTWAFSATLRKGRRDQLKIRQTRAGRK